MQIQFNTDQTVRGDEKQKAYFTSQIKDALSRFETHITRIEIHLSDENGEKEGINDKRCVIEARIEGRQPIAVTSQDDTVEQAVSSAIEKLKTSLTTIVGRTTKN